jgi:predicted HicB family RNase H-like nuclease
MDYLYYKGYTGSVEYGEEDNCLFGEVFGMTGSAITYEGTTLDELKADFEAGIDCYLDYCGRQEVKPHLMNELKVG